MLAVTYLQNFSPPVVSSLHLLCLERKKKERKEKNVLYSIGGWKHEDGMEWTKLLRFCSLRSLLFTRFIKPPPSPIPPRFYLAKAGSRWVVENRVRAVGGGQAGRQLPRRERYSPEENTKGEGALETEGGLITIGLMVYPRWWPEVPVRAHTHTHTHTLAHSRELVRTSSSCSLLVLHYRHHPIVAYRGSTDY